MIVSNTTPISNFLHLDLIHLLQKLFRQVCIPQAVADEVEETFHSSAAWRSALDSKVIVVVEAENKLLIQHMTPYLHKGEIEAITLGLEKGAQLCLIDDRDGRDVALKNKLPVTGTLGLLLKSKELGFIRSVKENIDILRFEKHFWITDAIYENILQRAGEK